jgi:hypothetical protein
LFFSLACCFLFCLPCDLSSQQAGSRDIDAGAAAAAAAAAAAVAAGVAGGGVGHLPSPPAPVKVSPAAPGEGSSAGNIDAFVKDAAQADTHDKVQVWLQTGSGSTELPPADQPQPQQQHLLHEQRLPAGAAPAEQQQEGSGTAAAAQAPRQQQQQQEQEQLDVFTAADSPFFTLMPPRFSSGSVELGPFKLGAGGSNQQQSSLQQGVSSAATAGGFGPALPSFMDPK